MNLHLFAKNRKRSRKRKKRSKSPLIKTISTLIRWTRNLLLLLIGASILITLAFRWINPPYTSFMIVQRISTEFVPYKINWASIKDISPHLLISAVASEDQKFPNHYGFDFKAIQSALESNKQQKSLRGASTITQQVAKNIFLWPKKSFFRKGLEAYFALLIETLWPKWRILEVYLNIAEFGPNIFGAKNAAYIYYKKSTKQLTQLEAATLVAVLPNPHQLHASQPSSYVLQRAEHISNQARSLGGAGYLKNIWD